MPEKFWAAWRRDNRPVSKWPTAPAAPPAPHVSDLRQLLKNKDGSIIMDKEARERMKIKTPGEALAYRRKREQRDREGASRVGRHRLCVLGAR